MKIAFYSHVQYMRPLAPSLNSDKIKSVLTFLAVTVLLGCAAYWIYTRYWINRHVAQQVPQDQPKNISPLFQKIHPPVGKPDDHQPLDQKKDGLENAPPQPLPKEEENQAPLIDQGAQEKEAPQPKKAENDPKEIPQVVLPDAPKQVQAADNKNNENQQLPPLPAQPKAQDLKKENNETAAPIKAEEGSDDPFENIDPDMEDIPFDASLTMEENIEKNLALTLKQERSKYSYGGMFCRYEGVYAALKVMQNKGKHDYVNFCNQVFAAHFEKKKIRETFWDLNISIDPDQRYLAWKILSDEMENTPLAIQGMIHSSEKCPPGKGIVLQFLIADHQKKAELNQFLTLLAHHLSKDSILTDSRPLGQEPLLGSIPCEGIPAYFSYGTDVFTVVDDNVWDELLANQRLTEIIVDDKVVKIGDESKTLIKASHYRTLGEDARVNPLSFDNPFDKFKIAALTNIHEDF